MMRAIIILALGAIIFFVIVKMAGEREESAAERQAREEATTLAPIVGDPEIIPVPAPAMKGPAIPNLFEKLYDGRDLKLGQVLDRNSAYTRYYITYQSGDLSISGIMNIPTGTPPEGGFPVLILAHGHIDTSIYTNGRGLKREQDYLARQGFVVIHPDYRNHAESSRTEEDEVVTRLGYVEDVINLVYAVRASDLKALHKEKFGLLGHSMGGGIAQTIAVAKPELIKAIILYAPVSMDFRDSYKRWIERRPEAVEKIEKLYGGPEKNPEFWSNVSAETFAHRIAVPIVIHHGTADQDVPFAWSEKTVKLLKEKEKTVELHTYPGEGHEFGAQWTLFMERSADFFRKNL